MESVAAFRAGWPDADIEVVLPRTGPIVALLSRSASRITIEPLLVLRRRHLARIVLLAPFLVLPALWRALAARIAGRHREDRCRIAMRKR